MKVHLLCLLTIAACAQAMEEQLPTIVSGDTPLHIVVRNKDYNKVLALLVEPTWMPEELPQNALFPADAVETMKTTNQGSPENLKACRRLAVFTKTMNNYLQHQSALLQVQRTALNAEAKTAFNIAEEDKAGQDIINLLNPHVNSPLFCQLILQKIQERVGFPQNSDIHSAISNLPAKDANGALFAPGDKIVIDGKEYSCKKVEKLA